ncbi:MAG TPA: hypothetical protein VJ417_08460 [Candidatus Glassbacteria bacterium]|nr:hypothetical protein [Candidatus Glassbacteria bacterium]
MAAKKFGKLPNRQNKQHLRAPRLTGPGKNAGRMPKVTKNKRFSP